VSIQVEVVYATPTRQTAYRIALREGATAEEAIRACGVLEAFPEINLTEAAIGVFGERAALNDVLEDKDRVEIYRRLVADPKEARRRRAQQRGR
jgi:putative ubiquitin-RnfH superfamily antitoxin RatB of RatAB toxin-antitoxin module